MMENSNWFKKHADTVVVLGGILSTIIWMNSQFSNLRQDIGNLKQDMAVVKTVLIMKNIMPTELAKEEKK